MQLRMPHNSTMSGLGGLERKELGIPSEADYVSIYCEYRNCTVPDNWTFYLLFSYFRLTAILQGVVRRAADGNGSNPEIAKTYEKSIPIFHIFTFFTLFGRMSRARPARDLDISHFSHFSHY